jgi:hypothetical protein
MRSDRKWFAADTGARIASLRQILPTDLIDGNRQTIL